MLVKPNEIKPYLKVVDRRNTPDTSYTWIPGGEFIDGILYQHICDSCNFLDRYMLREDKVIRGKQMVLCVDCAGIDDLEPIVQAVK